MFEVTILKDVFHVAVWVNVAFVLGKANNVIQYR